MDTCHEHECKQKRYVMLKGEWSDHNYMLHTTHMTRVGNIIVLPIITF
jgi:hypothetical protein